jgi:hypothetical protein
VLVLAERLLEVRGDPAAAIFSMRKALMPALMRPLSVISAFLAPSNAVAESLNRTMTRSGSEVVKTCFALPS